MELAWLRFGCVSMSHPDHEGNHMIFRQMFDPASSTLTYLLSDDQGNAVIIDPVLEHVEDYLSLFESLKLTLLLVLDTHVRCRSHHRLAGVEATHLRHHGDRAELRRAGL